MTGTGTITEKEDKTSTELAGTWNVLVFDDPVNLMDYVVFVFQELFGFDEPKATRLMLQVHNEGKAAVYAGPREQAEMNVQRLHGYGLWATVQR